jgi:hypothetical protein
MSPNNGDANCVSRNANFYLATRLIVSLIVPPPKKKKKILQYFEKLIAVTYSTKLATEDWLGQTQCKKTPRKISPSLEKVRFETMRN